MLLRLAAAEDIPRIVALLQTIYETEWDKNREFNPEWVVKYSELAIEQNALFVLQGAEVVGTAAYLNAPYWQDGKSAWSNIYFAIHPEHRSLHAFKILLSSTLQLEGDVCIGVEMCKDIELKNELFSRYGEAINITYKIKR